VTRQFGFSFEVSNEFLRLSPVAGQYVEARKARIAARKSAIGPRGGLYRLVSPPDRWRESQDGYAFYRNVTVYGTKREGRYVRPDRITPDLLVGDTLHFDTLTTPVVEGVAMLPDGRTVETESRFVSFPVVVP
jgi:hypothetical protein